MKSAALAEVCTVIMGQAPAGHTYNERGDGLPLIAGAGDFEGDYPRPKKYTTANNVRVSEPGDVIVGIRASIGAKVLADDVYCLGRGVAGLRAGPLLEPRYLWHWVAFAAPMLAAKGRGATFLQVNKNDIAELEIGLPPIEEQRRIASILNAADALRSKRRQALEKLDTLTQSIFIDMFGDIAVNDGRWPTKELGEVLAKVDSGKSPVCLDRPAAPGEWGVLKAGAVTYCQFDWRQSKALPPGVEPDPRLEVREGDVLFSRKNTYDLVAAAAYVHEAPDRLLMSDLIFRLVIKDTSILNGLFLQAQLIQPRVRAGIQSRAGGSAGSMPNISKAKLMEVTVCVPPASIQLEFARRATKAREVELKMRSDLAMQNELFQALQQRAFRGEL